MPLSRAEAVVSLDHVSKSFAGVRALRDVSFALGQGEIRAICGENGAGKSTLVKLLMGIVQPDAGTIAFNGEPMHVRGPQHAQALGLGFVAQELSLAPRLSVLDNIWLGSRDVPLFHRTARLRARAQAALAQLDLKDWDLDRPVLSLTMGERQMVEIARLLARDARVLILDEPTATLTDAEIARILAALKALKAQGRSIIYISHRLGEVFDLCDTVTVLRNGEHVATAPVAQVTRGQLIEQMIGRPLGDMYPADRPAPTQGGEVVVERLNVPGQVHEFTLRAPRGQIVCVTGQIGSGANMVTRALAGLLPDATGTCAVDGKPLPLGSVSDSVEHNVLFVSEDRAAEGLFYQLRVLDNLVASSLSANTRAGFLRWPALQRLAGSLAARVGVDRKRLRSLAAHLSGGNQQKLLFGRVLREGRPGVLLMNEPTRGVDVGARADIYRLMRTMCDQGYALIIASSDLEEVVGIADLVVTAYRGRVVGRYARHEIDMARILADITHPATHELAAA
jgi:ribose transport system ATP-binding protein/rhamnose transport system ATP-binding protein